MSIRSLLDLPSRETIHRVAVGASLLLLVGLYFDGWWHGTYGRHAFWIPPHVVIYVGVGVMAAVLMGRLRRDGREGRPVPSGYRVLGIAIALTLAAAPFDELWHRTFGVELTSSPLAIWSPPHLTGLFSAISGGLGVLATMVREDPERRLHWWMVAQAAAVVGFATFVIIPLEPTGYYRVAGIAGPSIIAFLLVGLRLMALSLLGRPGTVTGIAAVMTPLVILLARAQRPGFEPPPLPPWIIAVPAFAGAALLDLLARRRPRGLEQPETLGRWGMAYTALFASLFYPAANAALVSGWSGVELAAMIAGATLAAYPAGILAWRMSRRLAGVSAAAGPSGRLQAAAPHPPLAVGSRATTEGRHLT